MKTPNEKEVKEAANEIIKKIYKIPPELLEERVERNNVISIEDYLKNRKEKIKI